MDSPSNHPNPKRKLDLRRESNVGELLISGGDDAADSEESTVLASNSSGSSLTLLEEYALRKRGNHAKTFFIGLVCAAISITFAYLNFLKL